MKKFQTMLLFFLLVAITNITKAQSNEDQKKAERLRKEQTTSNKLFKTNIDILKAAEIISEKFDTNSIQDIIKNETIKTEYYNDNNLYKSTLSIKDTKLIFVSDYEGEKRFHVIIDDDDDNEDGGKSNYIINKFYEYNKKIETWAKKVGGYTAHVRGFDNVVFSKGKFKIEIYVRQTVNDTSILEISFYQ